MPSSYSLLTGRVEGLGKGNLVYPKSYGTIQRESIDPWGDEVDHREIKRKG
jgi:hypothetical protein